MNATAVKIVSVMVGRPITRITDLSFSEIEVLLNALCGPQR